MVQMIDRKRNNRDRNEGPNGEAPSHAHYRQNIKREVESEKYLTKAEVTHFGKEDRQTSRTAGEQSYFAEKYYPKRH